MAEPRRRWWERLIGSPTADQVSVGGDPALPNPDPIGFWEMQGMDGPGMTPPPMPELEQFTVDADPNEQALTEPDPLPPPAPQIGPDGLPVPVPPAPGEQGEPTSAPPAEPGAPTTTPPVPPAPGERPEPAPAPLPADTLVPSTPAAPDLGGVAGAEGGTAALPAPSPEPAPSAEEPDLLPTPEPISLEEQFGLPPLPSEDEIRDAVRSAVQKEMQEALGRDLTPEEAISVLQESSPWVEEQVRKLRGEMAQTREDDLEMALQEQERNQALARQRVREMLGLPSRPLPRGIDPDQWVPPKEAVRQGLDPRSVLGPGTGQEPSGRIRIGRQAGRVGGGVSEIVRKAGEAVRGQLDPNAKPWQEEDITSPNAPIPFRLESEAVGEEERELALQLQARPARQGLYIPGVSEQLWLEQLVPEMAGEIAPLFPTPTEPVLGTHRQTEQSSALLNTNYPPMRRPLQPSLLTSLILAEGTARQMDWEGAGQAALSGLTGAFGALEEAAGQLPGASVWQAVREPLGGLSMLGNLPEVLGNTDKPFLVNAGTLLGIIGRVAPVVSNRDIGPVEMVRLIGQGTYDAVKESDPFRAEVYTEMFNPLNLVGGGEIAGGARLGRGALRGLTQTARQIGTGAGREQIASTVRILQAQGGFPLLTSRALRRLAEEQYGLPDMVRQYLTDEAVILQSRAMQGINPILGGAEEQFSAEIIQAMQDFRAGRVYRDARGTWHIRTEAGADRGPVAPWNRQVRDRFPDHTAFERVAAEPSPNIPTGPRYPVNRVQGQVDSLSDDALAQEAMQLPKTAVIRPGVDRGGLRGIVYLDTKAVNSGLRVGFNLWNAEVDIAQPLVFRSRAAYSEFIGKFEDIQSMADALLAQGVDAIYIPEVGGIGQSGQLLILDGSKVRLSGQQRITQEFIEQEAERLAALRTLPDNAADLINDADESAALGALPSLDHIPRPITLSPVGDTALLPEIREGLDAARTAEAAEQARQEAFRQAVREGLITDAEREAAENTEAAARLLLERQAPGRGEGRRPIWEGLYDPELTAAERRVLRSQIQDEVLSDLRASLASSGGRGGGGGGRRRVPTGGQPLLPGQMFNPDIETLLDIATDLTGTRAIWQRALRGTLRPGDSLSAAKRVFNTARAFITPSIARTPDVQIPFLEASRYKAASTDMSLFARQAMAGMIKEAFGEVTDKPLSFLRNMHRTGQNASPALNARIGTIVDALEFPDNYPALTDKQRRVAKEWQRITESDWQLSDEIGIDLGHVTGPWMSHSVKELNPRPSALPFEYNPSSPGSPGSVTSANRGIFRERKLDWEDLGRSVDRYNMDNPDSPVALDTDPLGILSRRLNATAERRTELLFLDGVAKRAGGIPVRSGQTVEDAIAELTFGNAKPKSRASWEVISTKSGDKQWVVPKTAGVAAGARDALLPTKTPVDERLISAVVDEMRALLLSLDASTAIGRQGMLSFGLDPKGTLEDWGRAAQLWTTQEGMTAFLAQNAPRMVRWSQAGMQFRVTPWGFSRELGIQSGRKHLLDYIPGVKGLNDWQFDVVMPLLKMHRGDTILATLKSMRDTKGTLGTEIRDMVADLPVFGKIISTHRDQLLRMSDDQLEEVVADAVNNLLGGLEQAKIGDRSSFRRFFILTEDWTRAQISKFANATQMSPAGMVARRMILADLATTTAMSTVLSLWASGEMPDLDPRSQRFGDIKTPFGYITVSPDKVLIRTIARTLFGVPDRYSIQTPIGSVPMSSDDGYGTGADQRVDAVTGYLAGRVGQLPRIVYDIARGTDFQGRPISSNALYIAKSMTSILGQQVVDDLERDEPDADIAKRGAINFFGFGARPFPPSKKLDIISMSAYGKPVSELSPKEAGQFQQREDVRRINKLAPPSPTREWRIFTQDQVDKQKLLDEALVSGQLEDKPFGKMDWIEKRRELVKDTISQREMWERIRQYQIDLAQTSDPNEKALAGYYALFDKYSIRSGLQNGIRTTLRYGEPGFDEASPLSLDMEAWGEAEEEYLSSLPAAQRQFIKDNLHPNSTPMVDQYFGELETLRPYYELQDKVTVQFPEVFGTVQEKVKGTARATKERRDLESSEDWKDLQKALSSARERLRRTNPEIDRVLLDHGKISKTIREQDEESLAKVKERYEKERTELQKAVNRRDTAATNTIYNNALDSIAAHERNLRDIRAEIDLEEKILQNPALRLPVVILKPGENPAPKDPSEAKSRVALTLNRLGLELTIKQLNTDVEKLTDDMAVQDKADLLAKVKQEYPNDPALQLAYRRLLLRRAVLIDVYGVDPATASRAVRRLGQ